MKEQNDLENIIFDGLDGAPKENKPDVFRPIIAAVSAFLLLFSIILALTIALVNSKPTPKLEPNENKDQKEQKTVSETLEEQRARPTNIPSSKNADVSETEYRPSNGSGYINISSNSSISSTAALLEDLESGVITHGKNVDTRVQIASMTKVMTLIVACDYINDTDDNDTDDKLYRVISLKYDDDLQYYSKAFVDAINVKTEKVYYIDALYGLILPSGADCARGIAELCYGSEAEFVKKMNEKAAALGMTGTHFSNCIGMDDGDNNYSTVRDVATMFSYALKNELCYKILTTDKWDCIGKYQKTSSIYSRVYLGFVEKNSSLTFGKVKVLGGKSGKEDNAKYCLVSFGEKSDGHKYICVTAGHPSSSYTDTVYIYQNYVK